MRKFVIIVAGGKGLRMGGDIPKQFLPISGKPILMRTIERFFEYDSQIQVVLVLPQDHFDYWNEHIKYVYIESQKLAIKYGADMEIVKLGALLHDIALICKVGSKKDHNINGKILAEFPFKSNKFDLNKFVPNRTKMLGIITINT